MLKCKDVTALISSDELDDAGFFKRMEVRLHLLMCNHCNRYLSQIKSIGRGAKDNARDLEADSQQIKRMKKNIVNKVHGRDPEQN